MKRFVLKFVISDKGSINVFLLSARIGQCEVWCAPVEGFDYPNNIRHGLMPDGTPCNQDTYTLTGNEKLGFPRTRGISGNCVLGYCEVWSMIIVHEYYHFFSMT